MPPPNISESLTSARRPGLGSARLEIGYDIDDYRLGCRQRLGEGWRDLRRPLDANAAHAKAPRHRREVGRAEADQLLSPARPVAGGAPHAGEVLAKAGIVVDDDRGRDLVAARRFQLREMVIEPAIAGEAQYLTARRGTLGAERGRKCPAERAGGAQIGLLAAVELDHRAGPNAGIAGIRDEDRIGR